MAGKSPHVSLSDLQHCFWGLQKRYVHRDIAARNILLGANNQLKIGDFGISKRIPDGQVRREDVQGGSRRQHRLAHTAQLPPMQDFWKMDKAGRLPVKYMAPESLTRKRFYEASDVWAYGVLLWEILR